MAKCFLRRSDGAMMVRGVQNREWDWVGGSQVGRTQAVCFCFLTSEAPPCASLKLLLCVLVGGGTTSHFGNWTLVPPFPSRPCSLYT